MVFTVGTAKKWFDESFILLQFRFTVFFFVIPSIDPSTWSIISAATGLILLIPSGNELKRIRKKGRSVPFALNQC